MNKVLPIIIVCAVGIAFSLAYIVYLIVKSCMGRSGRRNEFEIEENSLIIKLGKRQKKK